jgi:hypothetical protein
MSPEVILIREPRKHTPNVIFCKPRKFAHPEGDRNIPRTETPGLKGKENQIANFTIGDPARAAQSTG